MSANMKNAATGAMNAVPSNAYSRPIAVFLFRIPRIVNMKETIGKLSSSKENKIIVDVHFAARARRIVLRYISADDAKN